MIRPTCRPILAVLCLALLLAPLAPAVHAEEDPPVPGPRDLPPEDARPKPTKKPTPAPAAPAAEDEGPGFAPGDFDLLPITDVERIKLVREHKGIVYRLKALARRSERMEAQLAKRKNKQDDGSKKLRKEIARVGAQVRAMTGTAVEAMRPYGVDEQILELTAKAPDGPYRLERYAHGLVLELDLDETQRALFERLVPEVNGAYFGLLAQRKRLDLFGKQIELEGPERGQLRNTVNQQIRLMGNRFWRVVDYVLTEDQRYELKEMLPGKLARVANAREHLFALPGLTPSQGTRIQSVLTEIEAENVPDQALVKRLRERLGDKSLPEDERKAAQKELQDAYARMQDLQLWSSDTLERVLTETQLRAFKAIPPGISLNERRRRAKQILEGMPLADGQQAALKQLRQAYARKGREMRGQIAEIRSKATDYGADSPQMGMVAMEMGAVQAEGDALQREALGRLFVEILTPEQVGGWVLGLYGRMR